MTFEKEIFGVNHTHVTLPNGKPGVQDVHGFALEQIAADTWVEWFEGRRVAVMDGQMRNLDTESIQKIIQKLEERDVEQIRV